MKSGLLAALFALLPNLMPLRAQAQDAYGAKGIYPVYENSGQWLIFDKAPKRGREKSHFALGSRFLVIGSQGAEIFSVARTSGTYGGACRDNRPVKLKAALLKGRREPVGRPIIGLHVPEGLNPKSAHARYDSLKNEVTEDTYRALADVLKKAAMEDIRSGAMQFKLEDAPSPSFLQDPNPDAIVMKIDFGARIKIKGLSDPFVLVEGTQVYGTYRRCLRLADGKRLVGDCVEMPHSLMAETALLQFVTYDPSGKGNPYLLAFTPSATLWGDERWGFSLRNSGPKKFLTDSLDAKCRAGF